MKKETPGILFCLPFPCKTLQELGHLRVRKRTSPDPSMLEPWAWTSPLYKVSFLLPWTIFLLSSSNSGRSGLLSPFYRVGGSLGPNYCKLVHSKAGVLVTSLVAEINTQWKQLKGSVFFGVWFDDKKVTGAFDDWSHSRQSHEVEWQMLVLCSLSCLYCLGPHPMGWCHLQSGYSFLISWTSLEMPPKDIPRGLFPKQF